MKTKHLLLLSTLLFGLSARTTLAQWGPPPARVTYQGYLTDFGVPANGLHDFQFTLYDSPTNGTPVAGGGPFDLENVPVTNGLFTVVLEFSRYAFDMREHALDIQVRRHAAENPEWRPLIPRQPMLPTPFALRAEEAGSISPGAVGSAGLQDGAVTASKVASGAVGNIGLADGSVTGNKLAGGAAVRSLNGLREDVTLSAGPGLALHALGPNIAFDVVRSCDDYDDCYWTLLGNAATVDGVNFLGTTDPVPLNLRVNSLRVMRYEYPAGSASPNLIGGYGGNIVSAVGGTISGGGKLTGINKVLGDYGTIGGGFTNVIEFAPSGTIGGGDGNAIRNEVASGTIGGGSGHTLDGVSYWPTISGGLVNRIKGFTEANTISGGEANAIEEGTSYSTIGGGGVNNVAAASATISGGLRNAVQSMALAGTIGGGEKNLIRTNSWFATVGGGHTNAILAEARSCTISGGEANAIHDVAHRGTIGGGAFNAIQTGAQNSTIGGGFTNTIQAGAVNATIGGGVNNAIQLSAAAGTIGGGFLNSIHPFAYFTTISGGENNTVRDTSTHGVVGGGQNNRIETAVTHATVSGGRQNLIQPASTAAAIGGGGDNTIQTNSPFSTIGGGERNSIAVRGGTIGGGSGNAILTNTPWATISGGATNTIQANAPFATIGGGERNLIQPSATAASIGGGSSNKVASTAVFGTISGGATNLVSGPYASVLGGSQAWAGQYGQIVQANGSFSSIGDAQASHFVLRTNTTSGGIAELFLDGLSRRMLVRNGATWMFDILISARSTAGNSAGYHFTGAIENVGAATFLVGTLFRQDFEEPAIAAAWDAIVEADNANDALVIKVTSGPQTPAQNVRWVAHVRASQVYHP